MCCPAPKREGIRSARHPRPDIATFAPRRLVFRDGRLMTNSAAGAGRRGRAGHAAGGERSPDDLPGPPHRLARCASTAAHPSPCSNHDRVGAVIAMSPGIGGAGSVAEQIYLGSNLIIVLSGSSNAAGVRLGQGSQLTITEEDAAAIAREVPLVQVAAPSSRGTAQVVYGNLNWSTGVQGVTADYFEARDWPVDSGRPILSEDVDGATKVASAARLRAESLRPPGPSRSEHSHQEVPSPGRRSVTRGQTPGTGQDDVGGIPPPRRRRKCWASARPMRDRWARFPSRCGPTRT